MCCFFFYFIKISKFALPGVMLMYERTSKDRKKERKMEMIKARSYFDYLNCLLSITPEGAGTLV